MQHELGAGSRSCNSIMADKSFERFCRLCAKEQEVTIMLFSTEAADMLLLEKLQKYLLIEINEDDKFSKNICIQCCTKLESLCEFIELVRKAQEHLHTISTQIESQNSPSFTLKAIKDEKTEITEICVDPMAILNVPGENSVDQFTYPYADDIVTLKLIPGNPEDIKNKKRFECDVCDRSFRAEQSLKNHSWIHMKEDYSCFTCQRSFRFQSDLENHIKEHDYTEKGFKHSCLICGRRFKTDYSYKGHMHIHTCTSTASYTCKICGRSYANLAGLRIHNITHSSEKPFKCSLCDKKFKRNQELKFHMNYHTGAKPYKCKFCDKCFASTGNLYSHKNRIHKVPSLKKCQDTQTEASKTENKAADKIPTEAPNTENKTAIKFNKFQCLICKKKCGRQENYTYHMYQHTGEKPYKCAQCSQKFITRRSLLWHYDNIHPNISRPAVPVPVFCPIKCKWLHD